MNLDAPGSRELTGRDLMETGLLVTIADQPGSVVMAYKRAK